MGLYDRDYGRDDHNPYQTSQTPWDRVQKPRSMTVTLIVINVVVFLVSMLFAGNGSGNGQSFDILRFFGFVPKTLLEPWMWWQFLTYGFFHDLGSIWHIVFNMIMLFVFGRMVENRMGGSEFLRFYLMSIIAGGFIGAITGLVMNSPPAAAEAGGQIAMAAPTIGASGGVIALIVMFACYFPQQELFLWGIVKMKAWVLAALCVGMDLLGSIYSLAGGETTTAFTVHLAGAGFALAYHYGHWNFGWLSLSSAPEIRGKMRQRSRRMKLKLHDPDKKLQKEADDADRLLAKIHEHGEGSLTSSERKLLERYSRRQREKRNQ
jgi:membrane associated rhomboid family serine protease